VPDLDHDEADGFDEVIFPVDFKKAGVITDDVRVSSVEIRCRLNEQQEMHEILVHPLPPGCRLTVRTPTRLANMTY
jgi:hypothetical protein